MTDATRVTVIKRDRKVSLRLSGMPDAAPEGVNVTSEEAQCAANAIIRLPKDNRHGTFRFGEMTIAHFPGHHQPVELRFGDADWSVVVDLSRQESFGVADMLRGAGMSDRPFDGEMGLQYPPRVADQRRTPLPTSLTSLLDAAPTRFMTTTEDQPTDIDHAPRATPRRSKTPKGASEPS